MKITTVQSLIDELLKIEDKSLPVRAGIKGQYPWSQSYPVCNPISVHVNSKNVIDAVTIEGGEYKTEEYTHNE